MRSRRTRRSNVEFCRIPGTNAAMTTTKSKMFQPFLKNLHGRGQYEATRSPSSTMKTTRHAAFSRSSSEPQRASSSSYVCRPSTTALTAMVATTTTVNTWESTNRESAFGRGTSAILT